MGKSNRKTGNPLSRQKNSLSAQQTKDKQIIGQAYSGPLPPPAYLQGYEQTLKGCANRIVLMAETLASHQLKQEERMLAMYERETKRGQYLVFALALAAMATAGLLAVLKNIYAGGTFLFASILFMFSMAFGKLVRRLLKL